jgi:hypothetical protein
VKHFSSKHHAFRCGVKNGTGSASFYKIFTKVKQTIGIVPQAEGGPLADKFDVEMNEARALYRDISQLRQDLEIDVLHIIAKTEEATHDDLIRTLHMIERAYRHLKLTVEQLLLINGLIKGNARKGMFGYAVSGRRYNEYRIAIRSYRQRGRKAERLS